MADEHEADMAAQVADINAHVTSGELEAASQKLDKFLEAVLSACTPCRTTDRSS